MEACEPTCAPLCDKQVHQPTGMPGTHMIRMDEEVGDAAVRLEIRKGDRITMQRDDVRSRRLDARDAIGIADPSR